MSTRTLNARTDLTYEEIYEGHANGRSRLSKMVKQIENGELALAESTGIDIKRRRTVGGSSVNVDGIGQTDTRVIAKLISAARFDALISGYVGHDSFLTPPSYRVQTVDVLGVTKETFDLLDEVAGTNFAEQVKNAASEVNDLTGREVKVRTFGSGVVVREIRTTVPTGATADIDVTDYFSNDRIGLGGATGELHGVDKTITGVTTSVGTVDDIFAQTVINLSDSAAGPVVVRYGTVQFGVIKIVGNSNGLEEAEASAYIVHPDFLADLILFQ